jgi:spermidine synthase
VKRPAADGDRRRVRAALAAAALLSGAAALVYQVLWARQLALVVGHTAAAVSLVLAAFMGGLAAGGAIAARVGDRLPRPALPRVYAALEAAVAGSALVLPSLLALPLPQAVPARLAAAAAVLLVPTAFMGATLPVLAALWRPDTTRLGRAAGALYAANTLGAVAGSLATAFFLLPTLGVRRSTLLAALMNVAAGAVAVWGARGEGEREERPAPAAHARPVRRKDVAEEPAREALAVAVPLAVAALSGLAALANEVAWTRALVLLIGPTAYAFAFIVTAVIAGLATGSALGALAADRVRRPGLALGLVEVAAAAAALAVVDAIGRLPVVVAGVVRDNADRMPRLMTLEFAGVLALLAPPSLLFGAAFPLAVRLAGGRGPAAAVGRVYAWNTAGAIAGALLAGFAALPRLGLETTLLAAAGVHAAAGAALVVLSRPGLARAALASLLVAGLALAARLRPGWDHALLAGGAYKYGAYAPADRLEEELRAGDLVYYREGAAATVSVKRLGGTLSLAVDGKVDATNTGDMLTQRMLAHLPLLLHPGAREVGIVGLGSGVTAGAALAHPHTRVEAVEISPEVVEAARLFGDVNRQALADPRLRVVVDDGRHYLLVAGRRFDVLISEPSNPWMAGVSALFTRDFFALARTRLAAGGLFCQWAHIYNMAPDDLRTVVASFTDVFPDAQLFLLNEGDVLLVGAEGRFPRPDPAALAARMASPAVRDDLAGVHVLSAFGLASLFALGPPDLAAWAGAAARHTDDLPVLEFRAARSLHADTSRANWEDLERASRAGAMPEPYKTLTAAPTAERLVERARMLEEADGFRLALAAFRRAAALEPASLPALEGIVRTSLFAGQSAEAEADLRALAAERSPVSARVALALLYHNQDRPADALAALAEAARHDPRNPRALLLGAEVQAGGGNFEAARGLAAAAVQVAPEDADARALLAYARYGQGAVGEALAMAQQALARDPRCGRALEVVAIGKARQGDRKAARRAFEALLAAEPDGWSHLNNFAVFELEGGDAHAAARLFAQAVALNPGNVYGYRGLRAAARALGDAGLLARAETRLRGLGAQ